MVLMNKGLEIRIYPQDELIGPIHQNIGNTRFVWNNVLSRYNKMYEESKETENEIHPSLSLFNNILNDLKQEFPFLKKSESTSLQQVLRDLLKAFKCFFNGTSNYPKHKSKKKSKKTFRVQNNNNSVRVENKKLRVPTLGFIKYKTSNEYTLLLQTSKINNETIKFKNGKYYAIVNVVTDYTPWPLCSGNVGIDMGMKTFATLSDGTKIANLDLTYEEEMIKKYQRKMSRQKYGSKNYYKTLHKYWKWIDKRNNIVEDFLHKLSYTIVMNHQSIFMETLNIKGMMQNENFAAKLQAISISKFISMMEYKCHWNQRNFIQVSMFFPSSKMCNICKEKYEELKLDMRTWTCPHCNTTHDRDINAAKNILYEGLRILAGELLDEFATA